MYYFPWQHDPWGFILTDDVKTGIKGLTERLHLSVGKATINLKHHTCDFNLDKQDGQHHQ